MTSLLQHVFIEIIRLEIYYEVFMPLLTSLVLDFKVCGGLSRGDAA